MAIVWVTLSVVSRTELTPLLCCPLYDEGVFFPFPPRLMKWLSSTRGVRGSNTEMRWPQLSVPSPPSYFFLLPALCSVTGTPRPPPDKAHAVTSLWRISFTIFPGNPPQAAKIKNKREVLSQCLSIPPPRLCPRHSAAVSTETFTSFTALQLYFSRFSPSKHHGHFSVPGGRAWERTGESQLEQSFMGLFALKGHISAP